MVISRPLMCRTCVRPSSSTPSEFSTRLGACFAESGYVRTSFLAVAARASVAPGVLHCRFRSKCALFLAVFDQTEEFVYGHLRSVARTQATFAAGIEAVLNEVHCFSRDEPSAARFLGTVGAELSQSAELRAARADHWPRRPEFITEMIEVGEARGELAGADRLLMADTITALIESLWQINNLRPEAQWGRPRGTRGCSLAPF